MKNPFKNARIVPGYNPLDYTKRAQKRGDKSYIMSRSQLNEFAACPSKWIKGGGDGDDDSTRSTEWGTLVDCLVTGGGFSDCFVIRPEVYPSEEKGKITEKPWNLNSKWCRNWVAEHAGKIVISQATLDEANKAADLLRPFVGASKKQVYVEAEYEFDLLTIPVCGLIDLAPDSSDALIDIKTARSADLSKWGRAVHEHWYDAQGAMYLDLWNAATGETRERFEHLIQENSAPYEIALAELSCDFISFGRKKYQAALEMYCASLINGHWPNYNDISTGLKVGGRTIVQPESWMVEKLPTPDPSWLTEKAA